MKKDKIEKEKTYKDFKEFINPTKKAVVERDPRESWMDSNENGRKGEIKTKLKLMEKGFWILERDIDVNGADLVVQKGNLSYDLIDTVGAPVAFVQIKNVGSKTNVDIDSRYIYYVDGEELKPKAEFFIFIYRNDNPNFLVFLSAEDIDKIAKSGECSTFIKTNTQVTYIRLTYGNLNNLFNNRGKGIEKVLEESVRTIDEALSMAEYHKQIGLRHFLGLKPNKFQVEQTLSKLYINNYDASLLEAYLNVELYMYRELEISAIKPFAFKDIITQIELPEDLIGELDFMEEYRRAYENRIRAKWDSMHPDLTYHWEELRDELKKAYENTLELRHTQTDEKGLS